MKRSGLACLAALAISVLAALPFAGRAQDNVAAVFDKTTSRLEKGGVSFSFTNGEAANKMADKMFDSFKALTEGDSSAEGILQNVRSIFDDLGFKSILGCGTSVKQHGEYYRVTDFLYAPKAQRKGLLWDLFGGNVASKGPAPELKLTAPNSAFAFSFRLEPGAVYSYVDKKIREILGEEVMAEFDQKLSELDSEARIDKLLECVSGITFYVEPLDQDKLAAIAAEAQSEDAVEDQVNAKILEALPKAALVITTKDDLLWQSLLKICTESMPDFVQDGKIVPVEGVAIFQVGNYLIATNEEAAIRDRIAGKGSDLTSHAVFAEMYSLVEKDFSNFAWLSEDYFNSISLLVQMFQDEDDEAIDPSRIFGENIQNALAVSQINDDGVLAFSITTDLQTALLSSETLPGVISGLLPYIGPFVKLAMDAANDDDDESLELAGRMLVATLAFSQLEDAKVPTDSPCVFFTIGEDGPVFIKWNQKNEDFDRIPADVEEEEFPYLIIPADVEEEEFPYLILTSPEDAAKAGDPEETVVFCEDPMEKTDGIYVMFADGSAKYLEGDFETYTEAMDAAISTFGISDDAAAKLLKKAAAIDKIFGE